MVNNLYVLIVEDHDFQRRTVVRMLHSLGVAEVMSASNGKQALALLHGTTRVDIVVCDLDMPEMDGLELMRHLGQEKCAVSVIITSAQERSLLVSVQNMAYAYGIRLLGVIEKPVTLKRLANLLARHEEPSKFQPVCVNDGEPVFSVEQILHGLQQSQFEPFFQPKMDLMSGRVVGAEALARWRHPEYGLIGPDKFIALLEQAEDIEGLTFMMLEKSAYACRMWRARGLELTVSVNLSFATLATPVLAEHITQVVRLAGLDPRHMILEITESMAMTEVAPALENLARLRMRGFGLSIDDYGTGFSSLQQLMRIPYTELKVDQSFVIDSALNPASYIIVASSIHMARQLGIKSVAEGVETQANWDTLRTMGCDFAQGYFVAQPMDERQFIEFLTSKEISYPHDPGTI